MNRSAALALGDDKSAMRRWAFAIAIWLSLFNVALNAVLPLGLPATRSGSAFNAATTEVALIGSRAPMAAAIGRIATGHDDPPTSTGLHAATSIAGPMPALQVGSLSSANIFRILSEVLTRLGPPSSFDANAPPIS